MTASVVEILPLKFNDNLTIPIISGAVMQALMSYLSKVETWVGLYNYCRGGPACPRPFIFNVISAKAGTR